MRCSQQPRRRRCRTTRSAAIEGYLGSFVHPADLLEGFASNEEKLANIGLFVPLGSVSTLLWRRPVALIGAGAALVLQRQLLDAGGA